MRVLITGCAGFIGFHLTQRLLGEGNTIVGVDNFASGSRENVRQLQQHAGFTFVEHDITNPLPVEGPLDRIYDMACPASPVDFGPKSIEILDVCSRGVWNVAEVARTTGARMLHASTSEVYGDPQVHPQPESYWGHVNPVGPRSCYDEGKRCAETLFFDYHRQHRLRIKVARIFNTYGPRMHPSDGRVVSNFIVQALRNDPLTIYGDGSQTRSFCYVDDMVEAFVRLMATDDAVTGPVNLGNPGEFTIDELAAKVIALTGSRSEIVHRPLPDDDPRQRRPDIAMAEQVLDWRPTVDLDTGLARTVAYFDRLLAAGEAEDG